MNWPWSSPTGSATLKTARLALVVITPEMMAAEELADGSVGKLVSARLTREWPPSDWQPHVLRLVAQQLVDDPSTAGWHRYVLLPDSYGCGRTLIGAVGGFPKPEHDVEIGYSTLPEFQRQGYGTEAALALVDWLLKCKGVRSVSAQTFSRIPESIKVMERCGMGYVGSGDEEGTVRYRRFR